MLICIEILKIIISPAPPSENVIHQTTKSEREQTIFSKINNNYFLNKSLTKISACVRWMLDSRSTLSALSQQG